MQFHIISTDYNKRTEDYIMDKTKKIRFHDQLLPVLFILTILPLITRLLIYDCAYKDFYWFPENGISSDFYTYYKGYSFIIVAVICLFILPFLILRRNKNKQSLKRMIPLFLYFLMVTLSTFLSPYRRISLSGTNGHFEGFYVLFAYLIVFLYSYYVFDVKRDLISIRNALIAVSIIFCILGFTQYFIDDPINWDFVQKMVMTPANYADYAGSTESLLTIKKVSLTLANPNFASTLLAMLMSFFMVYAFLTDNKKEKWISSLLLLFLSIIMILTLSRTGLVSVLTCFILFLLVIRKELKIHKKTLFLIVTSFLLLFILADSITSFSFTKKLMATISSLSHPTQTEALTDITTSKDGIAIQYKGQTLNLSFADLNSRKELMLEDGEGHSLNEKYDENTGVLHIKPFDALSLHINQTEESSQIQIFMEDVVWNFVYDDSNGYLYLNEFNKTESLRSPSSCLFDGYEDIASGRGYIWSRILPLLKNNLLLGSGPDTFAIQFPQNDRVGKLYHCKFVYSIIEKAHNLYLQIATQTGVLSLIFFLVFILLYLAQSLTCYQNFQHSHLEILGIACMMVVCSYLVSGFFNDSVIQTSPMFYTMLGIGFSVNEEVIRR